MTNIEKQALMKVVVYIWSDGQYRNRKEEKCIPCERQPVALPTVPITKSNSCESSPKSRLVNSQSRLKLLIDARVVIYLSGDRSSMIRLSDS